MLTRARSSVALLVAGAAVAAEGGARTVTAVNEGKVLAQTVVHHTSWKRERRFPH